MGKDGLIVITYTPASTTPYAYSDDLSDFSPYLPLPRRRVGFDPQQYLVGAGFGFVPTAYVPPQPQPPHRGVERSGTIMVGDGGIQAPFIPPAPTIAPPDIPLLARARRNVMDYAEINQDAPFQRFFPAGWEVQPPQPPRFAPTARKFAGLARGDDGTADKLNFFYPAGWEIQPPPPPQTRPERFGPMAPREDGVADIFRPFQPFAFEVQPPLVKHPRPERFAAIAPREDGIETALVVAATFTYSPDAWADQIRRRPFRWFPANDAQVDSPFANFYPVGWEVPGPQLPAQARAWRAILHPINVDAPFISSAAPPFFAADPAPLRRPSKAVPGFEAFALPAMPWLLTSFESPSSYPAKTNRAGATLPPGNIDALFVPASSTQPWGWEFAQSTPRWAAPRAGGLIQAPGPDSPLIVFSPQGWPVWAAEPSRRRVERAGAIAASSFIEASLVAAQQSWGWDLAPLALRSKMRPAGWLTAISGSDRPLVAFSPLGWAALLAEPPRRRWERAGGLARGDDGTQFGLIGFRPMGWEVQPHQPQHVRFERAAAGMIGDPGNEGTFSFITQPIVFGFDGPRIEYRPRRERAGALALGSPGNDAAMITWLFAGWEGPPLALRARMGREVGQIALPNVPPIVPPIVGWEQVPAALRANARRLASIPEPIFPVAAAPPVLFVDGVRIEHRPRRSRDLGLFDQGIVPRAPVVVGWETNPSGLLMRRVPRAVPSGADQPADGLRVFTPHGFDAQPTVSRVRPRPPQSTDIHATFVSVPAVIRFGWEFWHPLLRQQPNRRFVGALEWQRLDFRPRPIAGGPNLSFARDLGLWRVTAADQPVYVAAGADLARFSCKGTESVDGTQRIMGTYEIDTELEIIGTFADSLTGQADDPTVITLFLRDPTGAVQQLTYPADLSKDAVGEYSYKLAPTVSGTWSYKWQGTGAVIATSPDANFTVKSSSLITG